MMEFFRLLRLRLGGTLGMVSGAAFATGEVTDAQLADIPCEEAREGEERRIPASTGVASRKVRCEYDGSTWDWVEVGGAALSALSGPQGPQGATGATGATGDTGATGPQGPQGPAGLNGTGAGDVVGPGSSTDGTLALFDGTDGEGIREATGTGLVTVASGVYGTITPPFTLASSAGPTTFAFAEDTDNGSHAITLAAPASVASNRTQTLQDADGTVALTSDISQAGLGEISIVQMSDYTGTSNSSSAQKVFNTTTNGAATVAGGTLYRVDALIHIATTDTDSAALRFGFGGTATFSWTALTNDNVQATAPQSSGTEYFAWYHTGGADFGAGQQTIVVAVSTAKHVTLRLQGHILVNTGGTLIPQYSYSAANQSSPFTRRGSYFRLIPTTSTVGDWS